MKASFYFKKSVSSLNVERIRKRTIREETRQMNKLDLQPLSKSETLKINELWGGVCTPHSIYYKMFKTVLHFDERWVSDDLYVPLLLRSLNPIHLAVAYEHKGMYPILFGHSKIRLPNIYVNCINGTLYDSSMSVINNNDVIDILIQKPFIIKPSTGSCQGQHVRKVTCDSRGKLNEILLSYGRDWIAQEVLTQSSYTSIFNPSSVNTVRITSLYINGKFSVCNMCFRCGNKNSIVDNLGAGGYMVGVNNDGTFKEFGWTRDYGKFRATASGIKFLDGRIPNINNVITEIERLHSQCVPNVGIAGWDVSFDSNDEPILIEVNLGFPGIQFEQICSEEPLFGNRTKEVIDYVKSNPVVNAYLLP